VIADWLIATLHYRLNIPYANQMTEKRCTKSARKLRKSNKRSRPWQHQPTDRDGAAEVEAPDRLLVSALKFWEVEHDLIDERMGAIGVRQSNLPRWVKRDG